ncbi:hypothetical protein LTS17_002226 [Exophiala oligosperma]
MHATGALVCSLTFTVLSVLFGGVRFYTRAFIVKTLLIDDVLLTLSILASIALTTLIVFRTASLSLSCGPWLESSELTDFAEGYNGLGQHMNELSIHEIYNFLKALWGSTIVYSIGMMLTQNVFLFQYRNFFVGRWLLRITTTLIVIVTLFGVASTLALALQCVPTRYIWDPLSPPTRCIKYNVFWYTSAGFNTLTAIIIWILPIPLIKRLHLPKRQKYWLIVVFALGIFTCLASGLRIRALNLGVEHAENDTTHFYPDVAAWSCLEINVGIICACLPTLKPIVDKLFPRLLHDPVRRDAVPARSRVQGEYDRDGMYLGIMQPEPQSVHSSAGVRTEKWKDAEVGTESESVSVSYPSSPRRYPGP